MRKYLIPLCALGIITSMMSSADDAQAKKRGSRGSAAASYEIEFRSRPTNWVGHSYVVARKRNGAGRTTMRKVAGFWPDPTIPRIMVPFGSRGVVEARGDGNHTTTKMFRVRVDRSTFERVVSKMNHIARRRPTYNPFDQNCNTFVAVVARTAGVKAPRDYFQFPDSYVAQMQTMNASKTSARTRRSAQR